MPNSTYFQFLTPFQSENTLGKKYWIDQTFKYLLLFLKSLKLALQLNKSVQLLHEVIKYSIRDASVSHIGSCICE